MTGYIKMSFPDESMCESASLKEIVLNTETGKVNVCWSSKEEDWVGGRYLDEGVLFVDLIGVMFRDETGSELIPTCKDLEGMSVNSVTVCFDGDDEEYDSSPVDELDFENVERDGDVVVVVDEFDPERTDVPCWSCEFNAIDDNGATSPQCRVCVFSCTKGYDDFRSGKPAPQKKSN